MNNENPLDALTSFLDQLSWGLASYAAITVVLVYGFWQLAIRRKRLHVDGWKSVTFWLIALGGWLFYMYVAMYAVIRSGSPWSDVALIVSAILSGTVAIVLLRQSSAWQRVLSGFIIATIGFGSIASFAQNAAGIGYGLLMGTLLGLLVGLLIMSSLVLMGRVSIPQEAQMPIPGQKRRRVRSL